jgi:hypothetical protein
MSDVGVFRTTIQVAPLGRRDDWRELRDVMVDTGSEYYWIPRATREELGFGPEGVERFEAADGRVLTREIGWSRTSSGGGAGRGLTSVRSTIDNAHGSAVRSNA